MASGMNITISPKLYESALKRAEALHGPDHPEIVALRATLQAHPFLTPDQLKTLNQLTLPNRSAADQLRSKVSLTPKFQAVAGKEESDADFHDRIFGRVSTNVPTEGERSPILDRPIVPDGPVAETAHRQNKGSLVSYRATSLHQSTGLKPSFGDCELDALAMARHLNEEKRPHVRVLRIEPKSGLLTHAHSVWGINGERVSYAGGLHYVAISQGLVYDLQSKLPPMSLREYLQKSFPGQHPTFETVQPNELRANLRGSKLYRHAQFNGFRDFPELLDDPQEAKSTRGNLPTFFDKKTQPRNHIHFPVNFDPQVMPVEVMLERNGEPYPVVIERRSYREAKAILREYGQEGLLSNHTTGRKEQNGELVLLLARSLDGKPEALSINYLQAEGSRKVMYCLRTEKFDRSKETGIKGLGRAVGIPLIQYMKENGHWYREGTLISGITDGLLGKYRTALGNRLSLEEIQRRSFDVSRAEAEVFLETHGLDVKPVRLPQKVGFFSKSSGHSLVLTREGFSIPNVERSKSQSYAIRYVLNDQTTAAASMILEVKDGVLVATVHDAEVPEAIRGKGFFSSMVRDLEKGLQRLAYNSGYASVEIRAPRTRWEHAVDFIRRRAFSFLHDHPSSESGVFVKQVEARDPEADLDEPKLAGKPAFPSISLDNGDPEEAIRLQMQGWGVRKASAVFNTQTQAFFLGAEADDHYNMARACGVPSPNMVRVDIELDPTTGRAKASFPTDTSFMGSSMGESFLAGKLKGMVPEEASNAASFFASFGKKKPASAPLNPNRKLVDDAGSASVSAALFGLDRVAGAGMRWIQVKHTEAQLQALSEQWAPRLPLHLKPARTAHSFSSGFARSGAEFLLADFGRVALSGDSKAMGHFVSTLGDKGQSHLWSSLGGAVSGGLLEGATHLLPSLSRGLTGVALQNVAKPFAGLMAGSVINEWVTYRRINWDHQLTNAVHFKVASLLLAPFRQSLMTTVLARHPVGAILVGASFLAIEMWGVDEFQKWKANHDLSSAVTEGMNGFRRFFQAHGGLSAQKFKLPSHQQSLKLQPIQAQPLFAELAHLDEAFARGGRAVIPEAGAHRREESLFGSLAKTMGFKDLGWDDAIVDFDGAPASSTIPRLRKYLSGLESIELALHRRRTSGALDEGNYQLELSEVKKRIALTSTQMYGPLSALNINPASSQRVLKS